MNFNASWGGYSPSGPGPEDMGTIQRLRSSLPARRQTDLAGLLELAAPATSPAMPGAGGWKEGQKGWGAIANELTPFLAGNYAAPAPTFGQRSWAPQGINLPYLLGQGWGTPQGFGGGLLGGQNFSQLGLTPWWGQW